MLHEAVKMIAPVPLQPLQVLPNRVIAVLGGAGMERLAHVALIVHPVIQKPGQQHRLIDVR